MRLIVALAASITLRPVPMSPVTETIAMPGWLIRWLPIVAPRPWTTFSTPSGSTAAASAARRNVVSGVSSEGFKTTVLPVATGATTFQIAIING